MPVFVVFLVLALLFLIVVVSLPVLIPVSLFARYRAGTARQRARGWLATVNVLAIWISVVILIGSSAVTSLWASRALPYALLGLAVGGLLGALGLAWSRWESTSSGLHYTPNRWLVTGILLMVTARIVWSFWRTWQGLTTDSEELSRVAASGVAGSLGVGAVVVGYYLAFWIGVRRRSLAFRRERR
jgi:hypothetical protein